MDYIVWHVMLTVARMRYKSSNGLMQYLVMELNGR